MLASILAAGAAWLTASVAGGVVPSEAATPGPACSSASDPGLAAQMSGEITAVLRGRQSAVGLAVSVPATGLTCQLHASQPFDSASVVKATILAALLHRDDGRPDEDERLEATAMITESDNNAATDLWWDVGPMAMEQFLRLADMTQTVPGPGGYWGLTEITARDQVRLLHLLTTSNKVLDAAARSYELSLMSQVEPSQRWGVSAGAPAGSTVELKNGWLPLATLGWRINSIGCVSGKSPGYCLAVLTDDNPSMAYGVRTVSDVAEVVNQDLNSALAATGASTSAGLPGPARLAGTAQAGSRPAGSPGKGGPGTASATRAGGDRTSGPARGLATSPPRSILAGRAWPAVAVIGAAVLAFLAAAAGLLLRRRSLVPAPAGLAGGEDTANREPEPRPAVDREVVQP